MNETNQRAYVINVSQVIDIWCVLPDSITPYASFTEDNSPTQLSQKKQVLSSLFSLKYDYGYIILSI